MNNKKFSLFLILALSTILTACGKLPSVAGKDLQTVQDELDDMKRDYTYSIDSEYSDSIERGLVTRIVPESGTKAPKGSSIQIFVSKGAPITISDFYNSDAETAKTSLTSQGLAFTVNEKYSEDVSKGKVIKTNPSPGTKVEYGSSVEILISKGSEYRTMPDYSEISYDSMLNQIEDLGLHVDAKYDFSDEIEAGKIIECSASSGSKVSVNDKIRLTISKGPGIQLPSIVGQNKDKITAKLDQLGVNYRVSDDFSEEAVGTVIKSNYDEGDRVGPDDKIEMVVSKGTVAQAFKNECESASYDDLIRNPNKYKTIKIKIKAHVTKIENNTLLGLKYSETIWATTGGQEIVLEDARSNPEPALREGDNVTIYGYGNGTSTVNVKERAYQGGFAIGFSYNKTVDSYDIPNVKIEYIDF